ncbi:polysaccharide deacetylase family protein [Paracnuella aquatica]|uniref:polysaccharide deacetylase family protein n=1 Tax=Paracnuella aquatica TaxID=2268757 RepID=UPI000DEF39BC|nr:polysaccharide deacetylase family protein [Paracnuella aquatica]RPD43685.1 polysaccharide deacetylase family protein [Paracnuella aquatica]
MHRLVPKIPFWIPLIFPRYTWRLPTTERVVYLTFDDGPHPQITPFVLDLLKTYSAKATFFCIGKNVQQHPDVYQRILAEGHAVGNHTFDHLNGLKVRNSEYLANVQQATGVIQSNLFRPPYGRIRGIQATQIKRMLGPRSHIIMWDVLSADFDRGLTPEQCLNRVLKHTRAGSIIVFHDSEKAFPNLKEILPKALEVLAGKGFRFDAITAGL